MSSPVLRILVVDDHADSLRALAELLRRSGHDVVAAATVEEALRLALRQPPDLLVSDIQLTDGDGCELLRRIRAVHPTVRGIAVSGYAGNPLEVQCREAGYETMLVKPLVFERVLAIVNTAPTLGGVPAPLHAPAASDPAPARR